MVATSLAKKLQGVAKDICGILLQRQCTKLSKFNTFSDTFSTLSRRKRFNVKSVYCKKQIFVKERYIQYLYKLCYSRKKTKYIVLEKHELRRRGVIKHMEPDCYLKVASIFKTGSTFKGRNALTFDFISQTNSYFFEIFRTVKNMLLAHSNSHRLLDPGLWFNLSKYPSLEH